jgi:2-amino-4-hydroxy-6-hydroxymethyldihydropteridine diphosphokinase
LLTRHRVAQLADDVVDDGHEPTGEAVTAYLGLGASLGDRVANLQLALDRLHAPQTGSWVVAVSSLYESAHLGLEPGDEARFPPHLNAVAQLRVTLAPEELLTRLQRVEDEGGRVRVQRWGPRTIDLDLLLYGEEIVGTERLTVPHPGIAHRAFVALPLAEIAPELILPDGTPVSALIRSGAIHSQQIEPIDAKLRLPG